ncbi:MAG TPA: tubulin-like doman-containing protein, partial [Gemmataceae bacterium]
MAVHIAKLEEPIPGYRLLERLGRGGFGEVWKAEAPGGLLKAIKFVYGDLTSVGGGGEPAEQELKALNRVKTIRHPYILSLERFELIDGQLVIVMELADGNLWERYRECRAQGLPGIPRDELLRYMEETAEALDLMNHTYQIQHMDIKPQNLLSLHNHIKVADFGLAKDLEGLRATITGGVTPLYAAPETFEGWVSRFSDQYSLAIVYQELLTGRRPFAGANTRQLSLQHLTVMPDLTPLPEGDRPALARALSKKPDDRFPSCGEMVKALRGLGADGRGRSANGGPRGDPNEDTGPELGASTAHLITKAAAMAAAWAPPARPARAERVPGYPPQPAPPRRQPAPPQRTAEPGSLPPLTTQDQLLQYRAEPEGNAPRTRFRPWHGVMTQAAGGVLVPPEQTGSGVLFPALILGLGRTGLNALQQFRHAARDRFGRGVALPHVRLLYIDTDPEAAEAAAVAPPPACLSPEEICLARLNRPKHYLRREGIVPVESWLPNQVLYRLPRNPATLGVRCFGRLALCDNYRVIISRLRQALDTFPRTELLDQAAEQTGLKLRSNRPRVYVVAGLGGGTGGGMFLDLAYLVRRELQLMGYQTPEVIGLFLLPIPSPGLPGQGKGNAPAVANCHAALRELAYFTAPGTAYEFQFDEREPPVYDPERPFRRCVFLSLPEEERPR